MAYPSKDFGLAQRLLGVGWFEHENYKTPSSHSLHDSTRLTDVGIFSLKSAPSLAIT